VSSGLAADFGSVHLYQNATQDFSRWRLRDLLDKLDVPDTFVWRDMFADKFHQLFRLDRLP
jgi:hypothetical protein